MACPKTASSPWKINWLTICWVQVVPDFDQVAITMSPSRKTKPFHLLESITKFCSSRVFRGQTTAPACRSVFDVIPATYPRPGPGGSLWTAS